VWHFWSTGHAQWLDLSDGRALGSVTCPMTMAWTRIGRVRATPWITSPSSGVGVGWCRVLAALADARVTEAGLSVALLMGKRRAIGELG
jgi:hypothetical protein